jgi:hypothetical protein
LQFRDRGNGRQPAGQPRVGEPPPSGPATRPVAGDRTLVVVFLRGGMDGLNFVAPVDDRDYVAARPPDLRLTGAGDKAALPLAGGRPTWTSACTRRPSRSRSSTTPDTWPSYTPAA